MKDSHIIVALDFSSERQVLDFTAQLEPPMCKLKIGKELFTLAGPTLVRQLIDKGFDVFLDLKFHDIPSVISSAVEVAVDEKVYMLTMHALGGERMLASVAETVEALRVQSGVRTPLLLGVTVLTSLGEDDLSQMGFSLPMKEEIVKLASICKNSGLYGIVCSGEEISLIREKFPARRDLAGGKEEFLIVTPGVRIEPVSSDDQRRTITVEDALKKGADYLVMGRTITQSENPEKTVESILEKLNKL